MIQASNTLRQAVAAGSTLLTQATLRSLAPVAERGVGPLSELGESAMNLLALIQDSPRILVVTGAGISTASGIPDYRSPQRPVYKPLQHNEYMTRSSVRRRYWARSMIGFGRMAGAAPNAGHHAITTLQRSRGRAVDIITQNVDRLHQASGARDVLELHGTIHDVGCEGCHNWHISRSDLQAILLRNNASWLETWAPHASPRPDGDVELPEHSYETFQVPKCVPKR